MSLQKNSVCKIAKQQISDKLAAASLNHPQRHPTLAAAESGLPFQLLIILNARYIQRKRGGIDNVQKIIMIVKIL